MFLFNISFAFIVFVAITTTTTARTTTTTTTNVGSTVVVRTNTNSQQPRRRTKGTKNTNIGTTTIIASRTHDLVVVKRNCTDYRGILISAIHGCLILVTFVFFETLKKLLIYVYKQSKKNNNKYETGIKKDITNTQTKYDPHMFIF